VPDERPREVIGVARNTRLQRTKTEEVPAIYALYTQQPLHYRGPYQGLRVNMTFVLRASGEPARLLPSLRRAMADLDPNQPIANVKTVEQYLDQQLEEPRYYMMLLGIFAAVATVLAAVGIYGVMAYSVAQRTHEIGIRMALGARPSDALRLVLWNALMLVWIGLGVGIAGSLLLTQLIKSLLWGVTATDPITFVSVSLMIIVVALCAGLIPTRRAMKVDPNVALRYE
jgi:putative ABC transport system permease protein